MLVELLCELCESRTRDKVLVACSGNNVSHDRESTIEERTVFVVPDRGRIGVERRVVVGF